MNFSRHKNLKNIIFLCEYSRVTHDVHELDIELHT